MGLSITRVRDSDMLTEPLVQAATTLLGELVAADAAIGWTCPPERDEVEALLRDVVRRAAKGDACLALADLNAELVGLGYWKRYERPTHRPNADLEKMAVALRQQGHGYGRALLNDLVDAAIEAGIEQLTLDLREDNVAATSLYASFGFREYGRLGDFVAIGDRRLGKVFMVLDLRPRYP